MRVTEVKTVVLPAAIILAGFVAVVALSGAIERSRPALADDYGDSDLSINGSRLKGFAFGMEGLVADWYWMNALQYIGDKILSRKSDVINIDDLRDLNPRLLYPFLDIATDLDPHFLGAYAYGAIVMPAIDAEKAVALAEKGIMHNPDEWRLYQHLGYIHWKAGDYVKASEIYERGSRIAAAPPFMQMMAAAMKTEGGSRATARSIYHQMLADSDDPNVRITAEQRLRQLDALDEEETLNKVLSEFMERNGHCAKDLKEIVPMLLKIEMPDNNQFNVDEMGRLVDPTGVPYVLDAGSCTVELDAEHTQVPRPLIR